MVDTKDKLNQPTPKKVSRQSLGALFFAQAARIIAANGTHILHIKGASIPLRGSLDLSDGADLSLPVTLRANALNAFHRTGLDNEQFTLWAAENLIETIRPTYEAIFHTAEPLQNALKAIHDSLPTNRNKVPLSGRRTLREVENHIASLRITESGFVLIADRPVLEALKQALNSVSLDEKGMSAAARSADEMPLVYVADTMNIKPSLPAETAIDLIQDALQNISPADMPEPLLLLYLGLEMQANVYLGTAGEVYIGTPEGVENYDLSEEEVLNLASQRGIKLLPFDDYFEVLLPVNQLQPAKAIRGDTAKLAALRGYLWLSTGGHTMRNWLAPINRDDMWWPQPLY